MQTIHLPNYGKDILTIQSEPKPLRKRLLLAKPVLQFFGRLIWEIGASGVVRMIWQVRREAAQARQRDWSGLEQRGLSRTDLDGIIRKIVLAKAMVDFLGREKAARLRRELSMQIAYPVLEEVFAPPETFAACADGDFLPSFKHYYIALMEAMKKRGLEEAQVVEDTPDSFQINVQYCAWAEVAQALGDPFYCYFSTCQGDEIFFPRFCAPVGFQFSRSGTLATGKTVCDQRFSRPRQS